jgi:predicted NBD/HSP70 family sugar kinase
MSKVGINNPSANRIWIGVDIGGTKTAVVLSSDPPEMLARIEFSTLPELGPKRAIDLIK